MDSDGLDSALCQNCSARTRDSHEQGLLKNIESRVVVLSLADSGLSAPLEWQRAAEIMYPFRLTANALLTNHLGFSTIASVCLWVVPTQIVDLASSAVRRVS